MQLSNATPSGSAGAESSPSNSETRKQTAAEFVAELDAMDDEMRAALDFPFLRQLEDADDTNDVEQENYGYSQIETLEGFNFLLKQLLRLDNMSNKKSALLHLLYNKPNYDLKQLKEGFEALVLASIYKD